MASLRGRLFKEVEGSLKEEILYLAQKIEQEDEANTEAILRAILCSNPGDCILQ